MNAPILLHIRRESVKSLLSIIQSWSTDRPRSEAVRDLEETMAVCRRWPNELEELSDSLWRRAVANQIQDFQRAGDMVLDLIDSELKTGTLLAERMRALEANGASHPGAAEWDKIQAKLEAFRKAFEANWLWVNELTLAEARTEIARGEFQSVREILDELHAK